MDLLNVRKVMTEGDISTADHTVLVLVCQYIAGDRKTDLISLNSEFERINEARSLFARYRERLGWNENLDRQRNQQSIVLQVSPELNARRDRPKRQRRAPDRLNIADTKGSSYDN